MRYIKRKKSRIASSKKLGFAEFFRVQDVATTTIRKNKRYPAGASVEFHQIAEAFRVNLRQNVAALADRDQKDLAYWEM